MSFQFKCTKIEYDGTPVGELVREYNSKALPDSVMDKVEDALIDVNGYVPDAGEDLYVPILPPFYKKYDDLVEPSTVPKREPRTPPPTGPIEGRRELTLEEKLERRPIKKEANIKFRSYPYTFARPNETIEAVVRLYNDMNVSKSMISKLCFIFTEINKGALPPKLGQTVDIPVLLPFCYRHENNNKIFTDE